MTEVRLRWPFFYLYCSNGLGAFHHAALAIVKTVTAMHCAAVVPHNEVTGLPVMAVNELFLSEIVRQKGDGVLAFRFGETFDPFGMVGRKVEAFVA
jgi:hypothetical protein